MPNHGLPRQTLASIAQPYRSVGYSHLTVADHTGPVPYRSLPLHASAYLDPPSPTSPYPSQPCCTLSNPTEPSPRLSLVE
jgi:hypothetical protein